MPVALFGAGAVSQSFLSRISRLSQQLGPVAAPSYQVASRIVNSLGAGKPVRDCNAFQACRLVLLCVPVASVPGAVSRLAAAEITWSGKVLLLCNSTLDSRALAPVRERGAATGALNPIEDSSETFVVEGDRAAIRAAKSLVDDLKGKAMEFDSGNMALYAAGLSFASSLFTPLIAASVACLSEGARNSESALRIAEATFQRSLRAYLKAGKKSWSGPLASGDRAAVRRELEALEEVNPLLAQYYRDVAAFALAWFKRHPGSLPHGRGSVTC